MTSAELFEKAKSLRAEADAVVQQASTLRTEELKATPLMERMVFAAYDRCPCGAGMAYDPVQEDEKSVFKGPLSGFWDCSAIILGTADKSVKHADKLPFAFWELKSEKQPSVSGATTRPKV